MSINIDSKNHRSPEVILEEHIANTVDCAQMLNQVFFNLKQPEEYVLKVKEIEEKGDRLTEEAFHTLESLNYSEYVYLTEQLLKYLDDITDGIYNTARLIDICRPREIESVAYEILSVLLLMIESLQIEIAYYPNNELVRINECCKTIKKHEKTADVLYYEWRKKQRRALVLSLIEENNWTEILGVLEQTTDAAYHSALMLDRIARYKNRQKRVIFSDS